MSPRFNPSRLLTLRSSQSSQSSQSRTARRRARNRSRAALAVATAAAAAGIGAVSTVSAFGGVGAAGAPAAAAPVSTHHGAGNASEVSLAAHTTSALFNWVTGLRWPGGGAQLDSPDGATAPGLASTLTDGSRAATRGASHPVIRVAPHPAAVARRVVQAHAAPAKPAQPAAAAPAPAVAHVPFVIYDSVTPTEIPGGGQVATYANGPYAAAPSEVAGRGHVLWIDVYGDDPAASALDVEPGDATPAGAASWVSAKLSADHSAVAIIYTMIDEWQAVKDAVAGLPQWMQSNVRYWIADPTGVPHVVPGSSATQWYWGNSYDISTANPGFESS